MESRTGPSRRFALSFAAGFEGALVLAWIFLSAALGMPPSRQGTATAGALLLGTAAVLPLLPLLLWLSRSSLAPLRGIMEIVDSHLVPLLRPLTVTDFLLVALLAGVGEEGLFRGLLQGWLAGAAPAPVAVAAASLVFGLLHHVTRAYAVVATLMGAYLGWLHLATGNVVVPMTAHALYDFCALVYLVRLRPSTPRRASP